MRWRMCPKCGIKLTLDIDNDVTYVCNICGQKYIEINGKLERKIKKKIRIDITEEEKDDLLSVLDKLEKKIDEL